MRFFEQKLKHAIRLRGMRVEDFAAAMGVTRQAAYLLFKRPVIRQDVIDKICQVLALEKEYFQSPEPHPPIKDVVVSAKDTFTAHEREPSYSRFGNIIYVPLVAYGGFLQGYSNKVYVESLSRFNLPGIEAFLRCSVCGAGYTPCCNCTAYGRHLKDCDGLLPHHQPEN